MTAGADVPPTVLVLEPPVAQGAGRCLDRYVDESRPGSVLSVLYAESVEERANALRERADGLDSAAFVAVDPAASADGRDAVRTVPSPEDLTGVWVALTEWVRAREDDRTVVCLEGLSTLLAYVDTERAFRFLHAVCEWCRDHGVELHAHLTPSAHDERTVATVRQVFDEQRRVESVGVEGGPGTDTATAGAGNAHESGPGGD